MIKNIKVNLNDEAKRISIIGFHKGIVCALESLKGDLSNWIKDVQDGKKPLGSILVKYDALLKEQKKVLEKELNKNKIMRWWEGSTERVSLK